MGLSLQNKPVDLREYTLTAYKEGAAWLRDYVTAIKNGQLHPYTKLERKAREATRNEPWGPTGTVLNELAQACCEPSDCQIVFAVIQLRLGYPPAKWRNVYKALTLLEFLLKRGPENCVRLTKQDLLYRLQDLEGFQFVAPDGKDLGANVRLRAQAVHALAKDERRLKEERESFRSRPQEYSGFSRGDMLSGQGSAAAGSASLRRSRSDGGGDSSSYSNYTAPSAAAGEGTPQSKLQSSSRGAGEMKGVSMEDNKKQLAALKRLLERPENRACADCSGGGAASRASWASINTGAFICMRCAGIHRGLGVHISKVRSCTLDTWLPEQVQFMARTGNAAANAHFEARLDPSQKPSYYSPELEAFICRKYNGEYAKEGEEWPPAEAFSDAPEEDHLSSAPSQQANSTSRPSVGRPAGAVRQTRSAQEDEGFGESAFTGPGLQRAPSAPNLMDFGADTPTPPGSAGSAGHLESSSESIPIRQHPHQAADMPEVTGSSEFKSIFSYRGNSSTGVGMDEFEQLMAASAQPNLLDDHGGMSAARGDEDAMTPEPAMHSRQMTALGITPPRSLLSSFAAAARPGQAMSAGEASEFGPPTDFSAPGGGHAARSSTVLSSAQPSGTTYGFRPEPAAQSGAASAISGPPAEMGNLYSATQQPQASSAAPQMSYRDLKARRAGQSTGMGGGALYVPRSARELSFEGEPAPQWELSTACAPPPLGAIYSADFSANMQSVLQQHLQPLPNPSSAIAPLPKAAGKPYRPPGIPGGPPDLALVPAQQQQAFAPAEDAWYAQAALNSRPSAQQPPQDNRALPKVQGPRTGSSDPSGYVMEDLLAHAVDNMRIKNVSKTQLARRAEQPKPSLLEQKLGARMSAAKG